MRPAWTLLRPATAAILAGALAAGGCWKVDADLMVSARELDFGTTKSEATVTVTNDSEDKALTSGVTTLDYQFKCDRAWVAITPTEGHLEGGQSLTHTVAIDRSALADGENAATITVTSNGGKETITVLAVRTSGNCSDAPSAPSNPTPSDDDADVSITPTLSWQGGESRCEELTATYDVYFGTQTPPPFHHNNGSGKSWQPPQLAANTTYYWRIVAKDANGATGGATWSFRTAGTAACTEKPGPLSSLSPPDGTDDVPLDQDLSWSGGDSQCAGLTATYDVYFGTSSTPPFHHNNGTAKQWDPGTLDDGQTYYWKIVAKDANGATSSTVHDFRTLFCADNFTAPCSPSPADGKDNVVLKPNLSWGCGASTVEGCDGAGISYVVYLGTSSALDESDRLGTTTSKTFKVNGLKGDTTYYWKVVATNGETSKSSPVWEFHTRND